MFVTSVGQAFHSSYLQAMWNVRVLGLGLGFSYLSDSMIRAESFQHLALLQFFSE